MKTTLCAIASGLALAFAGSAAFAHGHDSFGSTATTFQGGYNNDAAIAQTYNSDASASIGQLGALNVANATQSYSSSGSDVRIHQAGFNNTANAVQTGTRDADSSITQYGAANVANTTQQYGSHQDAYVMQVGYNNTANVAQTGSSLSANAVQFGAKNVSTITQKGW